jgi:hypothetical protein
VLVLPLGSAAEALSPERISQAMQQAQLTALLPADPGCWQWLELAVAIPWSRTTCSDSAPGN